MGSSSVLSLQGISIRYGSASVWAVRELTFAVPSSEIFGLLGPNGSGKSSTLGAIMGEVPLTAGEIHVCGLNLRTHPFAYRQRIGLVPQELAIYEEFTGRDNLLFFGRLYGLRGRALRQRVQEALDFVLLTDQADRLSSTYSGGMQRRLNLACALLHQPRVLLLDEPTVGLDIQSREAIFHSLAQLREQGTAIVVTTHHLEEAARLCDRVAIVDQGQLVAEGTLDELLSDLCPLDECPSYRTERPTDRSLGYRSALAKVRIRAQQGGQNAANDVGTRLEHVFLELTGRSPLGG